MGHGNAKNKNDFKECNFHNSVQEPSWLHFCGSGGCARVGGQFPGFIPSPGPPSIVHFTQVPSVLSSSEHMGAFKSESGSSGLQVWPEH